MISKPATFKRKARQVSKLSGQSLGESQQALAKSLGFRHTDEALKNLEQGIRHDVSKDVIVKNLEAALALDGDKTTELRALFQTKDSDTSKRIHNLYADFDKQLETLLRNDYPRAANLSEKAFLNHLSPLRTRLKDAPGPLEMTSFVIVIKRELISADALLEKVRWKGKPSLVDRRPFDSLARYKEIEELELPQSAAYLLFGIDTGKAYLNVTPDDALPLIQHQNRSPLTLEEGIALMTHYPELLKQGQGFSLLGSRGGDKRVTAFWVSKGQAKLGWCWAGNPHTWLGSASCAGRCA